MHIGVSDNNTYFGGFEIGYAADHYGVVIPVYEPKGGKLELKTAWHRRYGHQEVSGQVSCAHDCCAVIN